MTEDEASVRRVSRARPGVQPFDRQRWNDQLESGTIAPNPERFDDIPGSHAHVSGAKHEEWAFWLLKGGVPVAPTGQITQLLTSWREGDQSALERLLPLIRTELHRIARRQLGRERKDQAVQPSSLVQETFLRLLPQRQSGWQNRAHFFAVASTVMRHVLVDYARQRRRIKRGGSAAALRVPLDAAIVLSSEQVDQVVAIDLALRRLAQVDARKSQVFEMRFFGGLSLDETAEALGVGARTVARDWRFARAWLRRELGHDAEHDGSASAERYEPPHSP